MVTRHRRWRWLVMLGWLMNGSAWAAPSGEPGPASRPAAEAVPRRPQPDYSGRPPAPSGAAEQLLWIPRVIFYPVHRLLDSFVRWPILRLTDWIEEYRVIPHLKHLFVWRDGHAGVFPTFFYEFGLTPSVGVYAFEHDLLLPRNSLGLHLGFGGESWIKVDLRDELSIPPAGRTAIRLRVRYLRRPDYPFFGIGPQTLQADRRAYLQDLVDTRAEMVKRLGELSSLRVHLAYRRARFGPGKEHPVETRFAVDAIPGFSSGYGLVGGGFQTALDTRSPERHASGSGLLLNLFGSYRIDPADTQRSFIRWGGELSGMLDVTGTNHVLGLRSYLAFADPLGREPVPFTELASLGGRYRMRGFLPGRFRGRSAVVMSATYRYPVWTYLDAELFAGLGNAFDAHLSGISLSRMFLSWGIALRTSTARDLSFDVLLGFGSNRLDSDHFELDSVNVALGLHPGF